MKSVRVRQREQDSRKRGVVPTPICQLFQIHGSIFEPDPSRDCGQASVMCMSHRVFLLSHRVDRFPSLRLSKLLHNIQVLLPDMCGQRLLPLLIGAAFCPAWAVPASGRGTSVYAFSVSVRGRMPQAFPSGADIGVVYRVIGIVPRLISPFSGYFGAGDPGCSIFLNIRS